jgi:Flp pilus assembly protein CpaB
MELVHKLTSTRAGTIAMAALAVLLAFVSILVYLNKYRHSVSAQGAPVTVLVAKKLIPKGTPGSAIAASGLFTTTTIRESQLRNGALADPGSLRGRVASQDIYPGQQLTTSDFAAGGTTLAGTLTKEQRLITLPMDSSHGMIGQIQAGDHVDVYAGFNVTKVNSFGQPLNGLAARPVLKLVMQNIPVEAVEKKSSGVGSGSSQTTNVSLRVTNAQGEELAFSSDNGKVWLVLRPAAGAKLARPGLVTVETVLLGVPPVVVLRSLGGK